MYQKNKRHRKYSIEIFGRSNWNAERDEGVKAFFKKKGKGKRE